MEHVENEKHAAESLFSVRNGEEKYILHEMICSSVLESARIDEGVFFKQRLTKQIYFLNDYFHFHLRVIVHVNKSQKKCDNISNEEEKQTAITVNNIRVNGERFQGPN